MFEETNEIAFDDDDYKKLNEGLDEQHRGDTLTKTAILSEDKVSLNRGIDHLENSIRLFKTVDSLRPKYNQMHRFAIRESIAISNSWICQAKANWVIEVEIPNASKEKKPELYRKHADLLFKVVDAIKELAEILLERAKFNDLARHKILMYQAFWGTGVAYKSLYNVEPTDENADLALKFFEKACKMYDNVPAENKQENIVRNNVYYWNMIQKAKNSPEAKKKWIDDALLDKAPS